MKVLTSVARLFSIYMLAILFVVGCRSVTPTSESVDFIATTSLPVSPSTQTTTPTPMKTPLFVNTLSAQQREDFVWETLTNSSNCNLPCWWGITPAESTWTETEQLLQYIGVRIGASPGYDPNTIFHGTGGFDFEGISIKNSFSFQEDNGVVDAILARSDGYNDLEEFGMLWANYSPQKIVMTYGIPDRVLLTVPSSFSSVYRGYYLWLFYDKTGFMIRYHGQVLDMPILHICPRFGDDGYISQIEIRLQSPENPLPLERFDALFEDVRKGTDTGKLRVIRSIQEAAGLDEKGFHEIFVQEDPACFDTLQDIWLSN
jgi:hypothetical protein